MGTGASGTPVPKVKGLNCPNCGAALTVRAFEQSVTVVCGSCQSILDAKDPNLQILQRFEAAQRDHPLIPLGTRGKIRGDVYEVIGFQRRTILVEGIHYSWHEYLLFNPYKGFRYLTEYNGHWNDVKTIRVLPETGVQATGRPKVKYLGDDYRHFQTAEAKTTYVLGEFPWQVRVGETVLVKDYVCPPHILSSETTENETTWSLGEYLTGKQVWESFKLPGSPPQAIGVYENQPSPFRGKIMGLWAACLVLLVGLAVMAIFGAVLSTHQEVFAQDYVYSQQAPGEHSFVTEAFDLSGHPSNVEVSIYTNLRNNWAYFNFALINLDTGQAYDFGREVSYYFGSDSDGPWTEGSTSDEVILPSVPDGHYYLRVEPEMDPRAPPVSYQLRIRRGVLSGSFFGIAALLLVLPVVYFTFRSTSFETRRWQESDYAS
jgi:hypothetical protein